jgi:hypothetical protein
MPRLIEVTEDEIILDPDSIDYSIALDRCKTPKAVDGWIKHLEEKTWMTPSLMKAFISATNDYRSKLDE